MVELLPRSRRLEPPITLDGGRRLTVWLLLAGLLLAVPLWWAQRQPDSLATLHLEGARGAACLRLVVAEDMSGSMSDFRAATKAAMNDFLTWAPLNLRRDDEVGVLEFAGSAAWNRVPAPIHTLAPVTSAQVDGTGTRLMPVLSLVAALPDSPCDTVLLLLSDGRASDLPGDEAEGLDVLSASKIHDLRLLVPGKRIGVSGRWKRAFPSAPPVRFDGSNVDRTALTFGTVIAGITGQRLARS